jgi:starch phosphorylase
MKHMTKSKFISEFKRKMVSHYGKLLDDCAPSERYGALASIVRDSIAQKWIATSRCYLNNGNRQVYYFSLEFLLGKFLESHLRYLDLTDVVAEGLEEMGFSLQELVDKEPEAGLGNGGLGRLAACFLDSMASLGLPGNGCGIRYKHGLFTQRIVDGYQVELPDNWLRDMNVWEIRKPEKSVIVKFGGNVWLERDDTGDLRVRHEDFMPVMAVPYDVPIPGFHNNTVNTLRLWSSETVGSKMDFAAFSRGDHRDAFAAADTAESISEVLYPDDSNYKNRLLRLKQQYFFVSAGLQSILRHYKRKQTDMYRIHDKIIIHINDTHPALVIPELMRLLIDEEGMGWDQAWDIITQTVAYTNHTILPEALEKWPIHDFKELLPRIFMIVEEIDRRLRIELRSAYPNDPARVERMAVLGDGVVRMANLAVAGSFSVNGVAAVHSELLKTMVMREQYEFYPEKFNNKTNGVTHRRWLLGANPKLAGLISEAIGDRWIHEPLALAEFEKHRGDTALGERLLAIRRENKVRLAALLETQNPGIQIDPDSIFDIQVKRIHAYKRQLLNALHVLYLYNELKENPGKSFTPRTFLIGGKAAPSYYYAKNIIKLISEISQKVNNDPAMCGRLKLLFLENYGVPLAERLFPAADLSEQISTATKEASGTGNMKFMLNGAVTVGTDDGANIEIRQLVGDDNFFLFGLSVDEVLHYQHKGGYHPRDVLQNNPKLARVMGQLGGDFFENIPCDEFYNITRSLLDLGDEYFVLGDFNAYADAHRRAEEAFRDRARFAAMGISNIAKAGHFSSDNTILRYAQDIWRIEPLHPEVQEIE